MDLSKLRSSFRSNAHKRARILLLYNSWFLYSANLREHVESFALYSENDVLAADVALLDESVDLSQFDVIVFHYSLVTAKWSNDLAENRRNKVINANALKVLFVQDEMRWVSSVTDAVAELDIRIIFSVQPKDVTDVIYKTHPVWNVPILMNVRIEQTLTGFVDERLISYPVPDYKDRKVDVAYRARSLPFWIGRSGLEKGEIATKFVKSVENTNLKLDISTREEDRVYDTQWFDFVAGAKATLGVESCAGVVDYDNKIFDAVDAYCRKYPRATFEQVEAACFPGLDGKIRFRAIPPRCFESAALRTLMIQYEGEYSGILTANKHYVVLNRDHSNIDDVVKIIQDEKEARKYIDAAYDDIIASGKYTSRAFMLKFDAIIAEHLAVRQPELQNAWNRFPYKGFDADINSTLSAKANASDSKEVVAAIQALTQVIAAGALARPQGNVTYVAANSVASVQTPDANAVAQVTAAANQSAPVSREARAEAAEAQRQEKLAAVAARKAEKYRIQAAREARRIRVWRSFALFFLPSRFWDWVPQKQKPQRLTAAERRLLAEQQRAARAIAKKARNLRLWRSFALFFLPRRYWDWVQK